MKEAPLGARPVSVVVPAHNEAAVIGRCLTSLLAGAEDGELDVVVVCNGCDDATAEVARRAAPAATVLEIPVASKIAALNTGDQHARHFPRFYVDADIELPTEALRRTAAVLGEPGVLCAAPKPSFNLVGRPWSVRAFYKVWQGIPYLNQEMVGSGVYALSEEGRGRFGDFPEITADDQYVQQLFEQQERRSVAGAQFVVHPPYNLKGLVSMRARAYRGNRELGRSGLARVAPPPSGSKSAARMALKPSLAPAVAVYAMVNLLARRRSRKHWGGAWERDESARSVAPGSSGATRVCYVTSHYPAVSHTFVMREIMGVRAAGLEVETVSVHRAATAHLLASVDQQEASRTWNIFPLDLSGFARAHARAVLGHPVAYARALGLALKAAPPGLRARLWQLFYFAEGVALWDHAGGAGARHLHAHLANVAADVSWWAAEFGKLAEPAEGWRWSFTMHGSTEFYAVERFNLRRKVAAADAVICVSEFTRSQLMYLSPAEHWAKLRVVHSGVDLERYKLTPMPQHPGLAVLCVTRLVSGKGLELLVDAIGALADRSVDVRLTLVGDGPLQASLRRRAQYLGLEARVHFAGAVGQDDMPGHYVAADVFCLPSFAEGVPVVLMEAMATGRPVVATRIAGIPELVDDGGSGLLVTPGSVSELAGALERLATSPSVRAKMGRAGCRRVKESFDAARCAAQVAEVFKEMAVLSAAGRVGR
jgi:glycosyltransferase involved in cell wall biosynthesis